jgi:hypothetical protein
MYGAADINHVFDGSLGSLTKGLYAMVLQIPLKHGSSSGYGAVLGSIDIVKT